MSRYIDELCNWEYTGEYELCKSGAVSKSEYITDCGRKVIWTRKNKIGKLFKRYDEESVPCGQQFYTKCPFCGKILNIVDPMYMPHGKRASCKNRKDRRYT